MLIKEGKKSKQEQYFAEICFFLKVKDGLLPTRKESKLNRTELRLVSEVIAAQYEGERVISTQLAKRLGITRSAVSQMVAKLEAEGVLRRLPSEHDKKIAYVEIAEDALEQYGDELDKALGLLGDIVNEFGEEKFTRMCGLFREFVTTVENKMEKSTK